MHHAQISMCAVIMIIIAIYDVAIMERYSNHSSNPVNGIQRIGISVIYENSIRMKGQDKLITR